MYNLEDMDLLEAILVESKVSDYINNRHNEDPKIKIKPSEVVDKAIRLFYAETSKPEFRLFSGKIRLSKSYNEDEYRKFNVEESRHVTLGMYDIENIRYNENDEDKLHDVKDLLEEVKNNVNRNLLKHGYYLNIEKDKDGEGDIILYKK